MVRVSLKNTFLSFDEHDEEQEELEVRLRPSSRQAASPRSRSVECMSPNRVPEEHSDGQIEKLNKLLDEQMLPSPRLGTSPVRSPQPGSGTASPGDCSGGSQLPSEGLRPRAASGGSGAGEASSSSYSRPSCEEGPSAQELTQLRRRLMEACHARGRGRSEDCGVPHVTSNGSISTMAADSCSEEGEEACPLQARCSSLPDLRQVWSSNSVSSLASDLGGAYEEGNVEFDLTIEVDPKAHTQADAQQPQRGEALDAPWVRRRQQPQEGAEAEGPQERGGQPAFGGQRFGDSPQRTGRRGAFPHSESGSGSWSPNASRRSWGARDRFMQWRPLPKEYRHGHVPKNLNLEDQYRASSHGSPPTTLMIRNIPNRYTQRELITELEDLGFASTFDFLYIPLDKGTMSNVGYAFVNFSEPVWAQKCMAAFQNYRFKRHRKISGKIAAISVAHIQGLEANLAHYEHAAVNTAKLKQRRPVIMANISQSLTSLIDGDGDN